jgi:hypothetical protein
MSGEWGGLCKIRREFWARDVVGAELSRFLGLSQVIEAEIA